MTGLTSILCIAAGTFFKLYEANINAWLSLIKKEMLEPTGLRLGTLCTVGNSMHIYDYNWDEAHAVLSRYKK